MGQTIRITKRAALQAEYAHDAFDAALMDGRLTGCEVAALQCALDAALTASSMVDVAAQIGVGAIRGTIGSRYSRELLAEFDGLTERLNTLPPCDAA